MKTLFTILTAIFVLFVAPLQLSAQTKRALVIGLGEQQDKNWAKINGDKDVDYVKAMLIGVGYKDIATLVNNEATKAAIVNEFGKLAQRCQLGDVVYIHFSGHGQQVTDMNGDEEDGLDESWIPYDAYLNYCEDDKGEKHLIDDEINKLLTNIKTKIGDEGAMLVVVDACHSGDSARGEDIEETVRGVMDEFVIPTTHNRSGRKTEKAPEQWLTLSACKDYQLNQELKNPQVGKLSYALFSISSEQSITMKSVSRFMQKNRGRRPQTPVLTGDTKNNKISRIIK